jgi:hypothetical protein
LIHGVAAAKSSLAGAAMTASETVSADGTAKSTAT